MHLIYLSSAKENIKLAFSILRKARGPLLMFELLHKLTAAYVILPFSAWILSEFASFSSLKFIGGENYFSWLFSPFILCGLFIVLTVLTLFTLIEVSFLTLVIYQYLSGKPLGFIRMLSLALKDSLRAITKKNKLILPFTLIMTPFSNSAILTALIDGFKIPSYLVEHVFSKPLYLCIILIFALGLFLLLITLSPAFIVYSLYDRNARDSFAFSKSIMKGYTKRFLSTFVLGLIVFTIAISFMRDLLYQLLNLITSAFKGNERTFAALLTADSTIHVICNFIVPCTLMVLGYSIVETFFLRQVIIQNKKLPKTYIPKSENKAKTNLLSSLAFLIFIVLSVTGYYYLDAVNGISEFNNSGTMIMAHRGASLDYPENTLPAFQYAVELQADYIELDVQLTSDGKLVVIHDSNLKRTTGYNAKVSSLTLSEIKELDAGYSSEKYRGMGITIPTLEEVFETIGTDIKYNIEIKYDKKENGICQKVIDLITKWDFTDNCVITSTHREALKKVKELLPDIQCGYILSAAIGNYYSLEYADFFSVESTYATRKAIQKAHKYGKGVAVWTVDSYKDIQKYIALGADSLITNDPLYAREILYEAEDPVSVLDFLLQT